MEPYVFPNIYAGGLFSFLFIMCLEVLMIQTVSLRKFTKGAVNEVSWSWTFCFYV